MKHIKKLLVMSGIIACITTYATDTEIWVNNLTPYRLSARIITENSSNVWHSSCESERVETFDPNTKRKGWWFSCGEEGWRFVVKKEWDNDWIHGQDFGYGPGHMSPDKPITLTLQMDGGLLAVYVQYGDGQKFPLKSSFYTD
jgi:hypothetical protein